uniref:Uncharacterized protein n=2 Tax=Opuntia streptacantha TaxID=393608 RepID=A0A7C9CP89_OPUST
MTSRKRRKKPPDPRLSPFDLLLDSSLPEDLATYLIYFWLRLQACRFPCSIFDHGLSAVPMSFPVPFRSQLESGVCVGFIRYCRRASFAPTMVPNFQNRGSRSANFERCWQDWHIRTLRFDPFSLICFWQTQVFEVVIVPMLNGQTVQLKPMAECFSPAVDLWKRTPSCGSSFQDCLVFICLYWFIIIVQRTLLYYIPLGVILV